MKRIFLLLTVYIGMLSGISAQTSQVTAPKSFTCRAMAWSVEGQILANDTINVQLSVLTGSPTGPRIYREFHTAMTDSLGIFNVEVGQGKSPLGLFSNINWLSDNHYLNIAIDPSGGNNFQTIATTQVMIVSVTNTVKKEDTVPVVEEVFKHYLGEQFEGGLIFYIYKDSTGNEHGLIASFTDVSRGSEWSNISSRFIGTNQNKSNGAISTNAIMAQDGHLTSAAKLCREYTSAGFADWYLPGIDELKLLWEARLKIIKKKQKDSSYPGNELVLYPVMYWSSTEYNADEAMAYDFNNGFSQVSYKYNSNYVRAVRKF